MNNLQLQTKVIAKSEMQQSAAQISDNLLEIHSGIESFVIVKNMIEVLKQAEELLKEKAIKSTHGTKEVILGAEVALRSTPRKYQYDGMEWHVLNQNLIEAKTALKKHQDILELSNNGWLNPHTGEIETATMVSGEGTTISITFPK